MPNPPALPALGERNPRNYEIGYKLALHHSMDNNRTRGTANIISVTSLLDACGDIPTYEEIQASKDRGHWERRIKAPMEATLDDLVFSEILRSCEYYNSNCIPLTIGQISIADYQTFAGLYIPFEFPEVPDQAERLQRKAEKKEAAKKRTRKKTASNSQVLHAPSETCTANNHHTTCNAPLVENAHAQCVAQRNVS